MKVKPEIKERSLFECIDAISTPEKQKGMTLGEFAEMISIIKQAADVTKTIQNPQGNNSDLEKTMVNFERRIKALEDKFEQLQRCLGGGYYDD